MFDGVVDVEVGVDCAAVCDFNLVVVCDVSFFDVGVEEGFDFVFGCSVGVEVEADFFLGGHVRCIAWVPYSRWRGLRSALNEGVGSRLEIQ